MCKNIQDRHKASLKDDNECNNEQMPYEQMPKKQKTMNDYVFNGLDKGKLMLLFMAAIITARNNNSFEFEYPWSTSKYIDGKTKENHNYNFALRKK